MGQPVEITNLEYSAADLRRLASREKRGEVAPAVVMKPPVIIKARSRFQSNRNAQCRTCASSRTFHF